MHREAHDLIAPDTAGEGKRARKALYGHASLYIRARSHLIQLLESQQSILLLHACSCSIDASRDENFVNKGEPKNLLLDHAQRRVDGHFRTIIRNYFETLSSQEKKITDSLCSYHHMALEVRRMRLIVSRNNHLKILPQAHTQLLSSERPPLSDLAASGSEDTLILEKKQALIIEVNQIKEDIRETENRIADLARKHKRMQEKFGLVS
mmetsp:Transcript_6575/g.9937  ORF Transcript_6575/g.9937 Transcript_6575/m.9937 type:complete len:208 (+) Transcript_6575:57-680(+)